MAGLKELKNKINVIESTRKVTSAMKLVAGVKLRKAEQKTIASREYAAELYKMISRIRMEFLDIQAELFSGRKAVNTVLLIVFSSDRGLCGNFNYMLNKTIKKVFTELHADGKNIKVICIGNKLFGTFKSLMKPNDTLQFFDGFYNTCETFNKSKELADKIISYYKSGVVDKVSVIYTKYYSAINREVHVKSIIPIFCEPSNDKTITIFEPSPEKILDDLLPYNITIQIYQCALESIASEQSSRMTSMDNATRNADTLLSDFKIKYNRGRQLRITQELTEIIAGANAVKG